VTADRSLPSLDAIRAENAWLRRLAGALTRDDVLAEDAVQETWLARLLHPPAEGSPGWLRVVLGNAVRKRARGDSRRQGREREAQALAGASVPDAHELAVRLEAQRLVAELVLALDEPYRSTVLFRYYEGLAPGEIARRQGIPAGTVRWRLKTGLDRVRAGLDEKYATPRRWGALLLPLVPGERVPWKVMIMAKATTKGAVLVVAVLLALLAGRRVIERGAGRREATAATDVRPAAEVASAADRRAFGTYRRGSRTAVPRFVPAVADATPPPRFVESPRRLDRSGNGPRNRLEHPPPNFREIQARVRGKLDEFQERAENCLAGWTAPDPALDKGVMLRIELDPAGLQAVSIDDLVDVPTGPLRCLGDAVYAIDWGGIVPQPMMLTVPQRYARPDGGR
jgi:RNA polymerase sigma-70 factor (ECF subfamily)